MKRSKPLKRVPFRRQRAEGPTVAQPSGEWKATPRDAERPRSPVVSTVKPITMGTYAMTSTVARPKGEKARPGKRAPTVAEREWMDKITAHGCIACRIDGELQLGSDGLYAVALPQVHHILRGGRRMGHLFTLPLCPGHHQDGTGVQGLIARHPWKARFEAQYGTEAELLARLRAEIAIDQLKEQSCE